jgi:hypothetical protein
MAQEETERLAVGKELADMMSSEADSAGHTGAGGACVEAVPVGDWRT